MPCTSDSKRRLRLPWALTFSFGRAIQQPALEIWGATRRIGGGAAGVVHRARCNRAALRGEYDAAMEQTGGRGRRIGDRIDAHTRRRCERVAKPGMTGSATT